MPQSIRLLLFLSIAIGIFTSCDAGLLDIEWKDENQRKLFIRLTDAPIEAEEVNVDIQGIVIKTDNGFDSVALETSAGVYNLLDYQDGADTLIGNAIIDFENIKEIRLILGENNSIKVNGELFPLRIPSGSQSGLKIKVNIDVSNDELVEILLDFDASKSIIDLGNGNYVLNPVITVASIISDGEEVEQEYVGTADCVRGKGYWKTHSEHGPASLDSAWLQLPDSSNTKLFATEKTYLSFLEATSGNDLYIKLAQHYIITELNVIAGVEIPNNVLEAWSSSGELLKIHAELQIIPEADEANAKEIKELLVAFNDGELGAESCEGEEEEEEEEEE